MRLVFCGGAFLRFLLLTLHQCKVGMATQRWKNLAFLHYHSVYPGHSRLNVSSRPLCVDGPGPDTGRTNWATTCCCRRCRRRIRARSALVSKWSIGLNNISTSTSMDRAAHAQAPATPTIYRRPATGDERAVSCPCKGNARTLSCRTGLPVRTNGQARRAQLTYLPAKPSFFFNIGTPAKPSSLPSAKHVVDWAFTVQISLAGHSPFSSLSFTDD